MPEIVLACRDCGQIYRASGKLLQSRRLLCRRCGARLWHAPSSALADPRAFAVTAAILLLLANASPLFEIGLAGDRRAGEIASGAVALLGYDGGIAVVGVLVGLIAVAVPVLNAVLLLIVLVRLRSGADSRARSGLAAI